LVAAFRAGENFAVLDDDGLSAFAAAMAASNDLRAWFFSHRSCSVHELVQCLVAPDATALSTLAPDATALSSACPSA
jgi:hypothetical protein